MLAKAFDTAHEYIKWVDYLQGVIEIESIIEFKGQLLITYKYKK